MTTRFAPWTLAVCVAAACVLAPAVPAAALTINVTFNAGASDSPGFDPTGALLAPIMQYAADYWEDIIEDSWTLDINYYYDDLSDANGTLADHVNQGTSGGKPTDARIRVDTQISGSPRDWWFDPTPANDSEFDLSQTLYRDLTAAQKTDWFAGSPRPVMEVGYRGNAVGGGAADGHYDILSTVIHEIGHAVGLTSAVAAGEVADGDYDVPGALVYNSNTDILEHAPGNYHIASRVSLMCSGCGSTSMRRLPTATDVFAVAAAAGWSNIDLPRQDFWGGSDWNTDLNWEGGEPPGAYDDAYIRLQTSDPTANLSANGYCASLFVGEGDNVDTESFKLDVGGTATVDGTDSDIIVRTGGELEADKVVIQNSAELYLTGGLVDANRITINTGTKLRAGSSGTPTVDVQTSLYNNGTIEATGDSTLTFTSSGGAVWDLDGSGNGIVQATTGDVVFASGTLSDAFDGDIIIGAGHRLNFVEPWDLGAGGVIDMNGGSVPADNARLEGGLLTAPDGRIEATGDARILADISFGSSVQVSVPGASDTLSLYGATTYDGGSYTGLGTIYQVVEATVSGDTTIDVATFDWDGGSGTSTTMIVGATLTVNSAKIDVGSAATDGYDGEVTVFGGTLAVNTDDPWRLDGTMNLVSGVVQGQDLRVFGDLQANPFFAGTDNTVESDVTFESGSTISVTHADTTLTLEGATTYNGATASGTGTLIHEGHATVNANTTIGTTGFDWDGAGLIIIIGGESDAPGDEEGVFGFSNTTIAAGTTLTINSDKIDLGAPSVDGYDGTVSLASGATLAVNTAAAWRLDGALNMNYAGAIPTVTGSQMLVYGDVNVTGGEAHINSAVSFQSTADVTVPTELELNGGTTFNGGTYTGAGVLRQDGSATVQSPTTIAVDTYDMDGTYGSTVLTLNEVLTLNVNEIDDVGEIFDGTLNINNPGILVVNTGSPWNMAGTMNLNQNGHANTYMVRGSDVTVSGQVNVTGATAFGASVHLTGTIDLGDAGDFVQLGGNNDHTIAGGQILGPGRVNPGGGSLTGHGTISADVDGTNSSSLWADDGTLTVSGAILDIDKIGTADGDGVLNVTNAWDTTVANLVELNGGQLTGATVTNANGGTIEGHGVIATTQLRNDGTISAKGGALTINTTNAVDLDGGTGMQGLIEAINGDISVVPALSDMFHDTLTIGQTRTVTFQNGWTLGNGGRLDLNGGTAANRARVNGTSQSLFGTVNVDREGHFGAVTTFEPTVNVNLPDADDVLRLFDDATVRAGATFAGDGTLANVAGSTLTLETGATVGVDINNAGTIEIGASPGDAKVAGFSQTVLGTLHIELNGRAAGTEHDQLIVTGTANPGGKLALTRGRGYASAYRDTMTIVETGRGVIGIFDTVSGVLQPGKQAFAVTYRRDAVNVTVTLPGDFDVDFSVGFSDFTYVAANYGQSGKSWVDGDADGDGKVTFPDFTYVAANYGVDVETSSGSPAAAPLAGQVELVVDVGTGEMWLRGNAATLSGYNIASASGSLIPDADGVAAPPFQFYLSNLANDVSAASLAVGVGIDGDVALDPAYNTSGTMDLAFSYGVFGQGGSVSGDVIIVPEPTCLVLLGLGGVILSRRRRRTST